LAAGAGRVPGPRHHRALVDELLGRRDFVAAVKKTGRKKIVLAGLWTETCVALPTVQAMQDGYEIYVVEDLLRRRQPARTRQRDEAVIQAARSLSRRCP